MPENHGSAASNSTGVAADLQVNVAFGDASAADHLVPIRTRNVFYIGSRVGTRQAKSKRDNLLANGQTIQADFVLKDAGAMPDETRVVGPGPSDRTVKTAEGVVLTVPADWERLPPGDAGMTRRVKSRGPTWTVKQKKGRRTFSLGVWAPSERIATVRAELEAERSTAAYANRQAAAARRRAKEQAKYVAEFSLAVEAWLDFDSRYQDWAKKLSHAVAEHATPVGSGTVARTRMISIERRAEAAVIAWMRHQTTAYDQMKIKRERGRRREVRRELAEQSRRLLDKYRTGVDFDPQSCPLQLAFR